MIYVASRKKNAAQLRAYRHNGVPIISTWIDKVDSPAVNIWAHTKAVWGSAHEEIMRCNVFVLHDGGDGAAVELGIAIGAGIPVIATQPLSHPLAAAVPCIAIKNDLQDALEEALLASALAI